MACVMSVAEPDFSVRAICSSGGEGNSVCAVERAAMMAPLLMEVEEEVRRREAEGKRLVFVLNKIGRGHLQVLVHLDGIAD